MQMNNTDYFISVESCLEVVTEHDAYVMFNYHV